MDKIYIVKCKSNMDYEINHIIACYNSITEAKKCIKKLNDYNKKIIEKQYKKGNIKYIYDSEFDYYIESLKINSMIKNYKWYTEKNLF